MIILFLVEQEKLQLDEPLCRSSADFFASEASNDT